MSPGKFVLVSTMKNEGPYILEWVAYNRVIGFDHIIIYTNDCTDGTNEMLTRLQDLGEVHFHPNKVGRGGIHRSALRQARKLEIFKQAAWVCVADIDEFLNIHVGGGSLSDLIASLDPAADVVSIAWKIFGSNGLAEMADTPVITQFTEAETAASESGARRRFVKSLFRRQSEFYRAGLHGPVPRDGEADKFKWCQPGGKASAGRIGNSVTGDYGYDIAQFNHYAVRSAQSYLLKKDRGRANHMTHSLSNDYWQRWNRGGEDDRTILRHRGKVLSQIAAYKSDPILGKLHDRAFDWHQSRISALIESAEYRDLWNRIRASRPTNSYPLDQ